MNNVEIKLNSAGIRELLKSAEITEACREQAEKVQKKAGEGFETQRRNYPERTGYAVVSKTYEAKRKNMKENTLLKAMGRS